MHDLINLQNLENLKRIKIFGSKIYLKKISFSNLKTCFRWLKDPQINKYLSKNIKDLTYKRELEWFNSIKNSNTDIVFSINTIKENRYIGNCGLHKIDLKNLSCELGIFIGEKEFQNKGFGTDAIKTLIKFAVHSLNIKKLYLIVYEYNTRALKVYEKCGFYTISILKNYHFYNDKYWNAYLMQYLVENN